MGFHSWHELLAAMTPTIDESTGNGGVVGNGVRDLFSGRVEQAGGKDWLLIKGKDSFAQKDWKIKEELTPAKKKKLAEKIPPCRTS